MISSRSNTVPTSVVIPTFRRTTRTLETLALIAACTPAPAEILIHVDAEDEETAPALAARFPDVRVLIADTPQGPGGGRNRLIQEARHEFVVSLDDDSFPIDADFFAAVLKAFDAHPEAGIIAMTVIHDDEPSVDRGPGHSLVADFVGCGCAYRRSVFLRTVGYVPVRPAYGMEEADLALQLIDRGSSIVQVEDLRVRHATNRQHQDSHRIVAAHIKNTLLLAFLRYPIERFFYGFLQYANRIAYSVWRGHFLGVLTGVLATPQHLWRYRARRVPVRASAIATVRALRRRQALIVSNAP